jgi:hypothetical protein
MKYGRGPNLFENRRQPKLFLIEDDLNLSPPPKKKLETTSIFFLVEKNKIIIIIKT